MGVFHPNHLTSLSKRINVFQSGQQTESTCLYHILWWHSRRVKLIKVRVLQHSFFCRSLESSWENENFDNPKCSDRTFKSPLFNLYLFLRERERQSSSRGGAEKEGDRIQSRLQAPSCQHRAWHGAWTRELQDHDLSWSRTLNPLNHPGTPNVFLFWSALCPACACSPFLRQPGGPLLLRGHHIDAKLIVHQISIVHCSQEL